MSEFFEALKTIIAIALTVIASVFGSVGQGTIIEEASVDTFFVDDVELTLWVADDVGERSYGLSRVTLDDFVEYQTYGMLFVFDEPTIESFWMNEMLFDLDFVWIADGEVVKIDEDILAPGNNSGEIEHRSSHPYEIEYVLELPAGSVEGFGIEVGDRFVP